MEQSLAKTNLTLESRNQLSITGVKKVKTTEPNQVVAALEDCMVVITGVNLSVENLSVKEGLLELTGLVTSIRYTNNHSKRFSVRNIFR